MEDEPRTRPLDQQAVRYVSLRDYARVIRRQRWILLAITLLVGGAALAYSLTREKTYEASAQLSFRDPLADAGLLGDDPSPEVAPGTLAQINAQQVNRGEVVELARRQLGDEVTDEQLAGAVSGRVSATTNLVSVVAAAGQPQLAADIANAFAAAIDRVGTREVRARLGDARKTLKGELKDARNRLAEGDLTNATPVAALALALSRITALEEIARPVTIVQGASPPGAPSSPRVTRNTAVGLMLGAVLGLLAAFGRDSLDRRFRTVHEVHEELGVPVLSRVADSAFGYHGLVRGLAMDEADFEAFRVLRTNLAYLGGERPPRSIVVTSGMPEEGKTTVSVALASASAAAGRRTLLVECDLRRPSLARRMALSSTPGLADYLRGEADPATIVQAVELDPPSAENGDQPQGAPKEATLGLACITAGSEPATAVELLDSERFRDFISTVSEAYELAVLDASPVLAVVDPLRMVPLVDGVLVCVRVLQATREEARAVRSALENLPERPTGAVVTGLRRGGPDAYEYYYGY